MRDHLEELLSCYLDGEVTPEERGWVEVLLRSNPEARRRLEELRWVREVLRALPTRPLPEDLVPAILHRAEALQGGWIPRIRDLVPNVWVRAGLLTASLAAALILGLGTVLRPDRPRPEAAEVTLDVLVQEHALQAASDPFTDRAYLGIVLTDAHLPSASPLRRQEETR